MLNQLVDVKEALWMVSNKATPRRESKGTNQLLAAALLLFFAFE